MEIIEDNYTEKQKRMLNDILLEEKFIIHEPKRAKGFLSIVNSVRYKSKIFKGIGSKNALKLYLSIKRNIKLLHKLMIKIDFIYY